MDLHFGFAFHMLGGALSRTRDHEERRHHREQVVAQQAGVAKLETCFTFTPSGHFDASLCCLG